MTPSSTPTPSSRSEHQRSIFTKLVQQLAAQHLFAHKHFPSKVTALLGGDHRFGSRDRKLYRALLFSTARLWQWVGEGLGRSGVSAERMRAATDVVIAFADVSPDFSRAILGESAADAFAALDLTQWPRWAADRLGTPGLTWSSLLPAWFEGQCPWAFLGDNAARLLVRKPLWVRRQRGTWEEISAALLPHKIALERSAAYPDAAKITSEQDLTKTSPWQDGLIEVQDLGSQRVLENVPISGHWLDACAGEGGKTLQLAQRAVSVEARDIRSDALSVLRERVLRAGLSNVQTPAKPDPKKTFDGVLVDAPCSGTGTWGRHPHTRLATTPSDIAQAALLQSRLLKEFAPSVRPGGLLVYATCSLCRDENEGVIQTFLSQHPAFTPSNPQENALGTTLWPDDHDGFFVSVLRRAS